MYLARKDLRAARGRFALVGIVIGLIAFLATMLAGLANGLVDDGISGLRELPISHMAFAENSQAVFSRSILTEEELAAYQEVTDEATPVGASFFNARPADDSGDGEAIDIVLFGVDDDGFLADASEAGAAVDATRSLDGGLVLSHEFSDKAAVGDEFTIVGTDITLPVIGFTFSGTYGHVPIAYTSLSTWQDLLYGDDADGRFSAVAIGEGDETALEAAAGQSGTELLTKTEAYAGSPGYTAESATMTLIRGFLLVISALVVGAFFTVWTIQRTRQIGLLKALGASSGYIIRDALGQLLVVLIIAVTIGSAAAFGMGAIIGDEAPFNLSFGSVLWTAGILTFVGMAGSLVALRRITSVDPAISLTAGV
ncbi:MAG: ABC transporter permease [Actinomycetia bacterium]|nr:ABC transporter permease [Actinomycetes bacterium]